MWSANQGHALVLRKKGIISGEMNTKSMVVGPFARCNRLPNTTLKPKFLDINPAVGLEQLDCREFRSRMIESPMMYRGPVFEITTSLITVSSMAFVSCRACGYVGPDGHP